MARGTKRRSQTETTMFAAARRLTRSQTRRHQAEPAPPPPPTVVATRAPTTAFVAAFLVHDELFVDRLVPFLSADDLGSLCDAINCVREGRLMLQNADQWQYMIKRDGLAGSGVTTPTVPCRVGCQALRDYLSRRSQFERFDSCVSVIAGDLETIQEVDGVRVDCLAFPTSPSFHNPRIGVAGCVHRRVAINMNRYLPDQGARPEDREVLTTPGNSTIKLLVHCVGPSGFDEDRRVRLYNTYSKALGAVERATNVQCAAFASISTGTLQYPKPDAAEIAMAAVRDIFRTRHWPAHKKVAFVCLDKDVLKAFLRAHSRTRRTFFERAAAFPVAVQEIPGAP